MSRPEVLAELADAIALLPADAPARVGIDGRSAAGKSTLVEELAPLIEAHGRPCVCASIDDFHPPGYKQRAAAGDFAPETYGREGYDLAAFRRLLLEPLGPGGSRRFRTRLWDAFHDEPFPEEWLALGEDGVLLVESAYLFLPELRDCFELTLWLEIDWETMLARVEQRDAAWVGSAERVRERYQRHWIPRHRFYEETERPRARADIVIDNGDLAAPRIVARRYSAD